MQVQVPLVDRELRERNVSAIKCMLSIFLCLKHLKTKSMINFIIIKAFLFISYKTTEI